MKPRSKALALYAEATRPRLDAIDRVRQQLDVEPAAPRRGWGLPIGAALVVAVVLLTGVWVAADPPPRALRSSDWTDAVLASGVHATFRGEGRVRGQGTPAITWRSGVIEISVDPDGGHRVTIETMEADVVVVGTLLKVERDALGTRVEVSHGTVEVTCSGSDAERIGGGQSRSCPPTTAAGMLGRARALQDHGASSERVLEAITGGLALAEGPISGELRAFRIQHLLLIGEDRRAQAYIDQYLALGTVLRRSQMARAGLQLAQRAGDCSAVDRYLSLIPPPERTAQDRDIQARCVGAGASGGR